MSGFRLNRTYALRWETGDLKGLEVDIRSTSIATVEKLRTANVAVDVAALLAEHIVSWNYEDANGAPLPATVEVIANELEESIISAIGGAWYMAATGVTTPLDLGSTSGEPSVEEFVPTEVL